MCCWLLPGMSAAEAASNHNAKGVDMFNADAVHPSHSYCMACNNVCHGNHTTAILLLDKLQ